jgi:hypothetical protein
LAQHDASGDRLGTSPWWNPRSRASVSEAPFARRRDRPSGGAAVDHLQLEHEGGRIDQRFIRVYAKRDGQWRAVAVQVFAVVE